MNGPCEEFADKILDYVDGELPEDEAQAVAGHLAECDRCRRTAEAMERSLGLAKVLWSANLDESESTTGPMIWLGSRRTWFYAIAASVLVTASTLLFTVSDRHPQATPIRFEDVERQVADAGAAAQLLAATQILAQCEGTESIVEEQYQYILNNYAGTHAAAMLANGNLFRRDSQ